MKSEGPFVRHYSSLFDTKFCFCLLFLSCYFKISNQNITYLHKYIPARSIPRVNPSNDGNTLACEMFSCRKYVHYPPFCSCWSQWRIFLFDWCWCWKRLLWRQNWFGNSSSSRSLMTVCLFVECACRYWDESSYAALFFNNFKLIQIQRTVLKYGVVIHFPSVITTFHSFPCFLLIFLFLAILCFRIVHVVKLFQFWWRSQSLSLYMWNLLVLLAVVVGTIWLVRVYKKENRTQLEKRKLFTLLHYPNDFFFFALKMKILTNFRKKILLYYFLLVIS